MAHGSQREFIAILSAKMPQFFRNCRVLEIGSLDINGSIRDFYQNCKYVGLDIGSGKGVDVVCEGQDYDAPGDSFDQVVSCEVMEHNPHWLPTFQNMVRLCRPGGLVAMTCATTGRSEHGTTRTTSSDSPLTTDQGWDYYQNLTKRGFAQQTALDTNFCSYYLGVNWRSYDLCFCGLKRGRTVSTLEQSTMEAAVRGVESYLNSTNKAWICWARQSFAALFGDSGFEVVRSIRARLDGRA